MTTPTETTHHDGYVAHTFQGHNGMEYRATNAVDDEGNPAGGQFWGLGISISWQDGPIMGTGKGPNGAFVEDVILAAIQRIAWYQGNPGSGGDGKFACQENAMALTHLRAAHDELLKRTRRRTEQGVEGKHIPHQSTDHPNP